MLTNLRTRLAEDVGAVFARDPAARSTAEIIVCYPGLQALWLHRAAHALYTRRSYFLARCLSHLSRHVTGIEIHPGAQIGHRVVIDHGMGVVIGETAEIGDDVLIYQGVTLGGTSLEKKKRHPTIRARAVLSVGSTVLGAIEVGEDARVGAGAVVTRPVAAGTTVVGVPAHPIQLRRPAPVVMPNLEHADLSDPVAEAMGILLERIERLEAELHILRGAQHLHEGNGVDSHQSVIEALVRDSAAG